MVLHADAGGRIRVLFPATPSGSDLVPGGRTFELAGASASGSFPVRLPGAGLVLAIRSTYPFDLAGLAVSGAWDYEHALLFQPTAGNPFAALLDVADRVTGGRPYRYDQAAYHTPGANPVHVASGEAVCLECFTAHAAAPSGAPAPSATATVVDCSNTTLVDAFCGVQDNRSYITEPAAEAPVEVSGYPVYVPLYVPVFVPSRRHFERPHRSSPAATMTIDRRLRSLPDRVVPPPPRRRPSIIVRQPRAPSRPHSRDIESPAIPRVPALRATPDMGRSTPPPRGVPSPEQPVTSASRWAQAPVTGFAPLFPQRPMRPTTAPAATTFSLPAMRSTLVPSRAVVRALARRGP
jgi:hypothetical protein